MGKRVNTTKKERLALLKELGYTEADMQAFWDELVEIGHRTISFFDKSGIKWTDLTVHQMRELPTLKEKTLKRREKDAQEKAKEAEKKQKKLDAKKYYEEHFEEIILKKIDNGEHIEQEELKRLVFDYEYESIKSPDVYKLTQEVKTIVKISDRFFGINWSLDLSDCECHYFRSQPYEVSKVSTEKTMIVEEWIKK